MANKPTQKPTQTAQINDNTEYVSVDINDIVVDGYTQDGGDLVDEKDIKRKSGFFMRLPAFVRAYFLNFWFGGAVCYFVVMGIFNMVGYLGSVIVLGLAYGLAADILLSVLLHAVIPDTQEFNKTVFYHSKKFYSVLINCAYSLVIAILIMLCYAGFNILITKSGGGVWGVEPLFMGFMYASLNLGFVSLKNLVVHLIHQWKGKAD